VAGEVNISPEHIAAAAAELDATRAGSRWLGASPARQIERIIDGEVDDLAWERIVSELRAAYGKRGESERIGATYEWSASFESGTRIDVSATTTNGKTRITLRADNGQGVMAGWMAGLVAGGMLALVLGKSLYKVHADLLAIVIAVLVPLLIGVVGSWLALRAWDQVTMRRLQRTLDRVAGRIPRATEVPVLQTVTAPEERHVQA
jgi:hypothetical protein